MYWRNPEEVLPNQKQKVWVMLEPHKNRGSLQESAASIQIVSGEVSYSRNGQSCIVDNFDELGHGSIYWILLDNETIPDFEHRAIAWMPVEDMIYPQF